MNFLTRIALVLGFIGFTGCAGGGGTPGAAGYPAAPGMQSGVAAERGVPLPAGGNPKVYVFLGQPDGSQPYGDPINVNGTIYGTTQQGGENNIGTVYSVTPGGVEHVLHSFSGSDGEYPYAGLLNVRGTLYGTTAFGGAYGQGCVYAIDTSGHQSVVFSFGSYAHDAEQPLSGVIEYGGALYGTTSQGGTNSYGAVYKLTLGTPVVETILYSFAGKPDGANPQSLLTRDGNAFYATTYHGGVNGGGTVFKLTDAGSETVLHSFGDGRTSHDGSEPFSGVIVFHGKLYGTTQYGGAYSHGTVYTITETGTENVLHAFGHPGTHSRDGVIPLAALVNVNGTLYGTTTSSVLSGGTVFSVSAAGAVSTVSLFDATVNSPPGYPFVSYSGVVSLGGKLYGTTLNQVGNGDGTVYAVAP